MGSVTVCTECLLEQPSAMKNPPLSRWVFIADAGDSTQAVLEWAAARQLNGERTAPLYLDAGDADEDLSSLESGSKRTGSLSENSSLIIHYQNDRRECLRGDGDAAGAGLCLEREKLGVVDTTLLILKRRIVGRQLA